MGTVNAKGRARLSRVHRCNYGDTGRRIACKTAEINFSAKLSALIIRKGLHISGGSKRQITTILYEGSSVHF